MGLTVAGWGRPLAGVVGGLAAPQIFLALGHQQRVTHVTVVKILEQQPLVGGGGEVSGTETVLVLGRWWRGDAQDRRGQRSKRASGSPGSPAGVCERRWAWGPGAQSGARVPLCQRLFTILRVPASTPPLPKPFPEPAEGRIPVLGPHSPLCFASGAAFTSAAETTCGI